MAQIRFGVFAALCCATMAAHAVPVGVDGTIGAEWGAPTSTVTYDPSAPTSNFGSPGTTNHLVGYSIYMRSDANYLYGAVKADSTGAPNFANIYFNVDNLPSPGSDLGLQVTNDTFFIPTTSAPQADTGNLAFFAVGADVIEFAIDWSMLLDDPYGMGFNTASPGGKVLMSLSQSFGYSVAGGASYGADRLGAVTAPAAVPEPGSLALVGLALAGLAGLRRRRG